MPVHARSHPSPSHPSVFGTGAAKRVCAAVLLLALAACGGGGGDAPSEPAAAAPPAPGGQTPPPLNPPVPPPAPLPVASTCSLPDFQASAMTRINQYRTAGATCGTRGSFARTTALTWNDALTQSSAAHSLDMATQNYFSHTSLDGRSMSDRITAAGYVWRTAGENIAAGQRNMDTVIDGWMASDGHCANLMNPAFNDVGLACVASSSSRYPTYWTMNLGTAR